MGLPFAVGASAGALAAMRGTVPLDAALIVAWGATFAMFAMHDLRYGVIRNRVVYPALGIAFATSPMWSDRGLPEAAAGGGVALASGLVVLLIARGGMGGGDLKMWLLVGLVVGYPAVWAAGAASVLAGGIVGVLILAFRRAQRHRTLAYAPYLALGWLSTLFL